MFVSHVTSNLFFSNPCLNATSAASPSQLSFSGYHVEVRKALKTERAIWRDTIVDMFVKDNENPTISLYALPEAGQHKVKIRVEAPSEEWALARSSSKTWGKRPERRPKGGKRISFTVKKGERFKLYYTGNDPRLQGAVVKVNPFKMSRENVTFDISARRAIRIQRADTEL